MTYKHSKKCAAYLEEFEKQYPNYCKTCSGWGGFEDYNYLIPPNDFDICDDCVGNYKCALCGEAFTEEYEDKEILPCGHKQTPHGYVGCICSDYVCQDCQEDMAPIRNVLESDYELVIYKCPSCGKEIKGI